MSSFNKVKKCKYESSSTCLISLQEYVIFEDEKAKKKCIIFSFYNTLVQPLYKFSIDVNQFDEHGDLIAKSRVSFVEINVNSNKSFTPNARLNVEYDCVSISVTLVEATFERSLYQNGVLTDITKNYVSYLGSSYETKKGQEKKEAKRLLKEQKKLERLNIKLEKKKAKHDLKLFAIRNSVDEGKAKIKDLREVFKREEIKDLYKPKKGSKAYLIICSILIGIGSIVGTFAYKYNSLDYSYNQFDYHLVKDGNKFKCYVSGYEGNEKNIVFDGVSIYTANVSFIDLWSYYTGQRETNPFNDNHDIEFLTVGINDNAFKNSLFTSFVNTSSINLTVGDYSFYNSVNLSKVSSNISTIGKYAFAKTTIYAFNSNVLTYCDVGAFSMNSSLEEFTARNANVSKDIFKGDNNLKSITINKVLGCQTLGDLFGVKNEEIPSSIRNITIHDTSLPTGFFYGVDESINIKLDYKISNMYGTNNK